MPSGGLPVEVCRFAAYVCRMRRKSHSGEDVGILFEITSAAREIERSYERGPEGLDFYVRETSYGGPFKYLHA